MVQEIEHLPSNYKVLSSNPSTTIKKEIQKTILRRKRVMLYHNALFQIIVQSHSNKNSMVLAQKQ
jgi:hypothetical protein